MNPLFQALNGANNPAMNPAGQSAAPMVGGPLGAFNSVLQRARQIASGFSNPVQMVRNYFPDVPDDISGNPEQIIGWLQQTGRVDPQTVQTVRQMMGGR